MSTLKIKTELTAAAAVVTVGVQVKLEPSVSTADIKLEQHTSDIDTKVEPGSDIDSEEDEERYIKSESDDDDDEDTDQQLFICKQSGCGRGFNSDSSLSMHQFEHGLQAKLNTFGKTYTLTRLSLDDRWVCSIPDCTSTAKTIDALRCHIRKNHANTMRQQQQHQQSQGKKVQHSLYFHDVDDFYMNGVRCGYHNTTGVFLCYECRLVPECLLTHLQQKHGCDEKPIDNSALPESVVNANANPNINQHTSNPYLAAAISQQSQPQQHQDIFQGWLCATSDCGYCGYTVDNKSHHKRNMHQGEQLLTVQALLLRLNLSKAHTTCFLVTRIDQASGAVTTSGNKVNRHKFDYSHNGLNSQDENEDDVDMNETTDASNQKRKWKCEYQNCERFFNSYGQLSLHRRNHKCEVVITVRGSTFALTRQSSDDRWPCPIPGCESRYRTICATHAHIVNIHSTSLKQKRASSEDEDNSQQQQQTIKRRLLAIRYLHMDGFYVCGTRCGYHNTIGVFICYECRLVPECLLTHLQEKHGYSEKSIDNSALPESAVTADADPNVNQHSSNSLLASAICEPHWQHHQDIVQGWLCVAPNCGHCCCTKESRNRHQYLKHKSERLSAVPALVLRLLYDKTQTMCFHITRLDTTTESKDKPTDSASQYNSECDDEEDDGDELVLSDYSD